MTHLEERTMASYLNLAQRYLPSATTSAASFKTIGSIARALPALPLTIFEVHLDDPRPDMDFLLSATPEQLLNQLPLDHSVKEWEAIQSLCHNWQNLPESDPFRQGVYWIWLEFDTSIDRKNNENPAIYFIEGFAKFYRENVGQAEIMAVLQKLLGAEPSVAMQKQFVQLFQVLPPGARLFSLGNMSGRDLTAVRVSLAGIQTTALVQYLDHIGWPGDSAEIESLISSYAPFFDHLALDLDVSEHVGPKIGLELYMKSRHANAAWQPLFNKLVQQGLCFPHKRDHLMNWTGFSNAYTDSDIWPTHLDLPESQGHFMFIRRFNHVKLTYQPQKPIKAKAYIALQRLHTDRPPLKITN